MLIRAIAHRMLQLLRESALFFFQTRIYRAAGQPDGGCRLVEQINRLVRQKPVCQIPAGKLHRRLHRLVRNADAVVLLKPRTKPLQNAQRLLLRRLAHQHLPEPALQRCILFNVLSILLQRRRADELNLAPPERRFEKICRVYRALGAARADNRVHLVDKENHVPRPADLRENVTDALFKLAAVFGPRQNTCQIEPIELLSHQSLRRLSARQPLRQRLDNCSLPHARFSDERGVILVLAAQNLLNLAELTFAPDDRLHSRRLFNHIFTILLQQSHACLPPLLRLLRRAERSKGFGKNAVRLNAAAL